MTFELNGGARVNSFNFYDYDSKLNFDYFIKNDQSHCDE